MYVVMRERCKYSVIPLGREVCVCIVISVLYSI